MPPSTPVTLALDGLLIPYHLHVHEKPLRSLEQAAEERGLAPGQMVRTLVFRLEDAVFILVLMAGPGQVSWPKLRRHLGVRRIASATPNEVQRVTGYATGAVSPFGLAHPLRLLADDSILAYETVSLGAGIPNAGVILRRDDLLRALTPEMGDFGERGNSHSGT
jgi:Cys-tRNA(Pro)/Cys-tRNA(Cys) deacylase